MDRKYRIVGETYGTLAVIVAPSPRAALGLFLSWFTDPNGPQLKRTGETTARYADGERVTVR